MMEIPALQLNGRSNPLASAEIRERSRLTGRHYQPPAEELDCDCGATFVPRLPEHTQCRACRRAS